MATSTTTCWVLLACLVVVSSSARLRHSRDVASPRVIVNGPLNTAVQAGQPVTLTCQASASGSPRVQWIEFTTNQAGAIISDNGFLMPGHPNNLRYSLSVSNDSTRQDLTINPTFTSDGGRYLCRDANAADFRYAQLVIIDALPNCTNTFPSDGVMNEYTYQTAECQVFYHASYGCQPFMRWNGYGNYQQLVATTNTSVWSGVHFNVSRLMDSRSFQCVVNFTTDGFGGADSATNPPSWNWVYQTQLIFVQYGPTNMSYSPVLPSYEVGMVLTCRADAMPLPTYTWTNLITLEQVNSQSFTITASMVGVLVLRCSAVNTVSTGNIFANITVNPPTTPAPSTTTTTGTTIPAVSQCGNPTGRWESQRNQFSKIIMCITVDTSENGLIRGLFQNDTNEPYLTELVGKTRSNMWDELGFAGIWPQAAGVSAFAGECRRCYGVETMIFNTISRSSADFPFCTDGGTVTTSPQFSFSRVVPASFPCGATYAEMKANMETFNRRVKREAQKLV